MNSNVNIQLWEAILETISSEVQVLEAVKNSSGKIIDFEYLLGTKGSYGNEDLKGRLMLLVYPWKKEMGLFDKFVKVVETGETLNTIIQYPENGHKWYRIKAKKFNNGLVLIREDISVAKQSEEKIMQLNLALFTKNRELEAISSELKTFNSIAANQYNETLKSIYNSMEFLVKNDAKNLTDAGKANIRRAQASIQKMKLLTDDIISFSKVNTEEDMTKVDLNDILSVVLKGLEDKIKEDDVIVRADRLPVIPGYSPLLSLLFYHLINNAIKFRKEELQPIVDIKHKVLKGTEIEHSAALRETNYHMISIIDNGIGFPAEEGEKIFTMFYRLHEKGKHKGSGIGLAICKKVMDLHGGFIASECTPECTTFKCYFPIRE